MEGLAGYIMHYPQMSRAQGMKKRNNGVFMKTARDAVARTWKFRLILV